MKARNRPIQRLGNVLGQVARSPPGFLQRTVATWQITEQLDADEAMTPRLVDVTARHEPAHREVHVQSMTARMPLPHPQVGQRRPIQLRPQPPEEQPDIRPQLPRVVTTLTAIRQGPQAVEAIGSAVPANLPPSTTSRLTTRPLRISTADTEPTSRRT